MISSAWVAQSQESLLHSIYILQQGNLEMVLPLPGNKGKALEHIQAFLL
jgi:hypothetical protein